MLLRVVCSVAYQIVEDLVYQELAAIRLAFPPIKSLAVDQRGVNFLRRCLDNECAAQLRDRRSSRLDRPTVILVCSDMAGGERVNRDIGHIETPRFYSKLREKQQHSRLKLPHAPRVSRRTDRYRAAGHTDPTLSLPAAYRSPQAVC